MKKVISSLAFIAMVALGTFLIGCDSGGPTLSDSKLSWEWFASPTNNSLHSLYRLAANDIWSVGDNGNIIHWDGKSWTMQITTEYSTLNDVFMLDPVSGWAVGDSGCVIQIAEGSCNPMPTGLETNLNAITMDAKSGEGWIVGDKGTIVHIIGGTYEMEMVPEGLEVNLNCVGITINPKIPDLPEIWAMGKDGTILQRINGVWTQFVSPTFRDINCLSLNIAGFGWAGCDDGVILRYREGLWEATYSPTYMDISAICGLTNQKVWIGTDIGETYFRTGGGFSAWEQYNSPAENPIGDLCFNSDLNGWGVGKFGGIIRLQ